MQPPFKFEIVWPTYLFSRRKNSRFLLQIHTVFCESLSNLEAFHSKAYPLKDSKLEILKQRKKTGIRGQFKLIFQILEYIQTDLHHSGAAVAASTDSCRDSVL